MKIQLLNGRTDKGYTTFGSVYKAGEIYPENTLFELKSSNGEQIAVQSRITAIWPDGSVKWAAHTARAEDIKDVGEVLACCKETKACESMHCIHISEEEKKLSISTGKIEIDITMPENADENVLGTVTDINGNKTSISAVLRLEERKESADEMLTQYSIRGYFGKLLAVELMESGPLQAVVRFDGIHISKAIKRETMPFQIFMYVYADCDEIRFTHTLFYDGDADKDFLKGFGVKLSAHFNGNAAERFVQLGTDKGVFKEAATMLFSNNPKLDSDLYERQMNAETDESEFESGNVKYVLSNVPVWNRYSIVQDSAYHYRITKRTKPRACSLLCLEGRKAAGFMSVTGSKGGVVLGIRDLWKKYPSGFEVEGLGSDKTEIYAWFYSPEAETFDFRHYDDRSYPDTLYEGFSHVDASPRGIAVTSELKIAFVPDRQVNESTLSEFDKQLNRPAIYVAAPEYYHEKRAFGYWSLPSHENEVMRLIEGDLDKAFDFYKNEVDLRNWYGLFDYGDVMHKYDTVRHTWRYDMGGYAWQNTELAPTYLLWFYFLRTIRGDVFDMAEAMTRHCSEVDMYHLGERKGIGTRHNVRHWGCSCKEPRISMAGHHRFYYYLTGDYRIGEVLSDSRDAEKSMKNLITSDIRISQVDGKKKLSVRSGPDWTSFLANWMTEYERTGNKSYLDKILAGIDDIYRMPYGLASGPEYLLDLDSGHLEYTGEHENSINMHLQVCQGGTQIWLELLDVLACTEGGNTKLRKLLSDYGAFYMLSKEEKKRWTNGEIADRPFSFPYFASVLAAFSAVKKKDNVLVGIVIEKLLAALYNKNDISGFKAISYGRKRNGNELREIPWISTNFTSQWGLNMIVTLEFLKDYFPRTLDEMKSRLVGVEDENFHLA